MGQLRICEAAEGITAHLGLWDVEDAVDSKTRQGLGSESTMSGLRLPGKTTLDQNPSRALKLIEEP